MRILAVNCGSSSLKHALFECEGKHERVVQRGSVERIGERVPDHVTAVLQVMDELQQKGLRPDAVGHRLVHGGPRHSGPELLDDTLRAALEELVPFAPLHLPAELSSVQAVRLRWPDVPQVACFDTAFHRTLSTVARRYPVPDELVASGIERYGFHGLSYEYVVAEVGAQALGRALIAHLGSGASMAAVRDGLSVDTTMGFSPAGGLVMGTRMGDIDPGLLVYLLRHGYHADKLAALINHQAGLLAVSGTSADVRQLLARRAEDGRAALAIDVFTWSARKWVGALTATLGGLDTLVFTGGIGEHAAAVRSEIGTGLEYLGVSIDAERNARADHYVRDVDASSSVVSHDGAACRVLVVRTDEERMIARHTQRVLEQGQHSDATGERRGLPARCTRPPA